MLIKSVRAASKVSRASLSASCAVRAQSTVMVPELHASIVFEDVFDDKPFLKKIRETQIENRQLTASLNT